MKGKACPSCVELHPLELIRHQCPSCVELHPLELIRHHELGKRILDLSFICLSLPILIPVVSAIVFILGLSLIGRKESIFYKQTRVGYGGKLFVLYKFRSMKSISEEQGDREWTSEKDPRITGVGKFLRKTGLDELPQLINVVKGEMSLVGPRPERPYFVEKFQEEIPHYNLRHQVLPGITGWAQLQGWKGDTCIQSRVQCDLEYCQRNSLWWDCKILFLSFFLIFSGAVSKDV